MGDYTLKTGSTSILLGNFYYKRFFPEKKNKLLKVSKLTEFHNEFCHLDIIRTIPSYKEYYSIPDKISNILKPSDSLYVYIKNLIYQKKLENEINIFKKNLNYFFVDIAGNKELFDIFIEMEKNKKNFWKNHQEILKFTEFIFTGILFLHKKKICHLDIKPENIMVNTLNKTYKIIDFGFASKYPFDDFIGRPRGTNGYFPKQFKKEKSTTWFPKIHANDFDITDGTFPAKNNRKLVYKIDSFCLGRVLYILRLNFNNNRNYNCFNYIGNNEKKLNNIIGSLLISNVYNRLSIIECVNKYFSTNLQSYIII